MAVIRPYEAATDLEHVRRIWREVGWLDGSAEQDAATELFFSVGDPLVGVVDGAAECAVHRTPGVMRYDRVDLRLAAITGVTTGRVGRRMGLASRMTARSLADAAAEGFQVAALGMFDQGFYDRHGFGSGPYEHTFTFDPASLRVDVPYRIPVRLDHEHAGQMHTAMLARHRPHGGVALLPAQHLAAEMVWTERRFALGYRDERGELTHFVMGSSGEGENAPLTVTHWAWRDGTQLLELLRLLAEMGDQVPAVTVPEPPGLALQDLLHRPLRAREVEKAAAHTAAATWQLRILDLPGCVAAHTGPSPALAFTLGLTDPLATQRDSPWAGIGGEYTVRMGDGATATPGATDGLPVLRAGVGAFSRMWFGVRPASELALSTDLDGPPELLDALDRAVNLPPPRTGMDF